MLELIVAEEAELDLIGIGEYTESEWGFPQRNIYMKNLVDRFYWLAKNPKYGKDSLEVGEGYFSYQEGKYQIFYIFNEQTMTVIGVLHGRMDFEHHL